MDRIPLGNRPSFLNPELTRLRKLEKIKKSLIITLANYIEKTSTKTQILQELITIQDSTCQVITKNVNGIIIPGVTIPNSECSC